METRRPALVLLCMLCVAGCGEPIGIHGDAVGPILRLDVERIPPDLQHLAPLAEDWSLDDVDRSEQIGALSGAERRAIVRRVEPHLDAIDEWVDSYDPATLPEEVAAFFWLRLAIEEMRS